MKKGEWKNRSYPEARIRTAAQPGNIREYSAEARPWGMTAAGIILRINTDMTATARRTEEKNPDTRLKNVFTANTIHAGRRLINSNPDNVTKGTGRMKALILLIEAETIFRILGFSAPCR